MVCRKNRIACIGLRRPARSRPGDQLVQQPQQLPPIRFRAASRGNSRAVVRSQLLKLSVERLPIGADTGVAEVPRGFVVLACCRRAFEMLSYLESAQSIA
jgi:hypothetical protein